MKDNRVVVTGGAGFIGSNLARRLAANNDVIVIDDLSTGRESYLADLIYRDSVKFVRGSILDFHMLTNEFKGIDYVFHQAALVNVPHSIDDPLKANETNVAGTLNVLIASRDNHVKKVVNASSAAVYGDNDVLPTIESSPLRPLSPYAVTKLVGEMYCDLFSSTYGLPTVSLRYFNVYGPRQAEDSQYASVIPAFISRILHNEPPIIHGDGEQTRDFVFVDDVVEANLLAAQSDRQGVFNIGGGKGQASVAELARLITGLAGCRLVPVHEASRDGDIRHSLADISKAQTIGYKPQWKLEQGLLETIDWFRQESRLKGRRHNGS